MALPEQKKADLVETLEAAERARRTRPLLHPNTGNLYRDCVIDARDGVHDPDRRSGATTALRAMVDEIVLTPKVESPEIVPKGNLAAMLVAAGQKGEPEDLPRQVKVVAGPATSGTCSCGAGRHELQTLQGTARAGVRGVSVVADDATMRT